MDELDPEVKRVLELVREARAPTQGDKARMDALIAGSVGLGATASAQAAAQGAAKGGAAATSGAKVAVAVAMLGVVGLGATVAWQKTRRDETAPNPQASSPVVVSAPPASQAVAPAAQEQGPQTSPTPERAVVVKRITAAESAGARQGPREPALPEEELDLLHAVQVKWRNGDARAALVLLKQHRARYPQSQLESERDALTALSLCALGRREDGQKLARRFIREDPRSPLRATVEESCLR